MRPAVRPQRPVDPHMLRDVAPGGPAQASEREAFARDVFATIPNIKDIRLTVIGSRCG